MVRLALLVLWSCSGAEAGFRSPESLVSNVYAYYGSGAPDYRSEERRVGKEC